MRRFLPHLFWLSGIGVFVFASYTTLNGTPAYEHMTPEQEASHSRGLLLNDIGAGLILIGLIWILVRFLIRLRVRDSNDHVP